MSNFLIPFVVFLVIIYGFKRINIYDAFIDGASQGFGIVKKMFPSLLAMILGVNIFINSGFVSFFFSFLKPILGVLNIPFEILPLAIMRPLSGSFGLGFLSNMYNKYGPDSYISILSSVMQGSSDTTLYIVTLYFGIIGIKNIRYALWVGLLADFIMVILSLLLVPLLT